MEKVISYLSILLILLLASGTSELLASKSVLVCNLVFLGTFYFYTVKTVEPVFIIIIILFILISGIYYLQNDGYNNITYIGLLIKIYFAYFCRGICKEHFSRYFIQTVFVLACISLPLYIIQLINFEFIYNLNNLIRIEAASRPLTCSFVFTLSPIHEFRNCGFMWEPGAFAAVLTLAIYINIFHELEDFFSKKNIIFIIAILTTQSTMGVLSLLIHGSLIFYQAFSENKAIKQLSVILVPLGLTLFIIIFNNVDFLSKKIFDQIKSIDEELDFVEKGNRNNFAVAATRITSILIDMETIKKYPLLGLGADMYTIGNNKRAVGELTITCCGLSILVLRFGFIGLLAYTYLFYRQALFEKRIEKIGWVCLLFVILFSNDLSGSSFMHLFIF